jgi:diguanylate cyclase (GGDEF)-like protein
VRRQVGAAALALGGVTLLTGAYASSLLGACGLILSTALLGSLVLWQQAVEPRLKRSFRWLVAALGVGLLSGVLAIAEQLVTGGSSPYPAIGDVVGLGYVPLTVTGLMVIPLQGTRRGFRARAMSDGFVAASSLLYLLEPLLRNAHQAHAAGLGSVVAVAYPLGGLFVVSAGLTTLARCADSLRPFVRWLVLGVSLVSVADLGYAVDPDSHQELRRATFQLGLLVLFGGLLHPIARPLPSTGHEVNRALGVLPFLPFAGAVVYSGDLVLSGESLAPEQLVLGIVVALALVARQVVGGRDKDRLVAELADRESRLQQELRVDPLTGAANRLGLQEAVNARLSADSPFSLLLLDLDDFKLINDNHGHAVGDEVLRQVTERLREGVRTDDVVARLGGDEFALLLRGRPCELEHVSERVLAALERGVQVGDRRFRVGASIGLVGNVSGDTVERLLADADGAMYQAKSDRTTNSIVRLDGVGRESVARRSQVREEIAHPDLSQFSVHYQPVVDLPSGQVAGMEALLRWEHPQLGSIAPDLFIPLAEQCGSIHVLGELVLHAAVADLAALGEVPSPSPFAVGINVSPRQLAAPSFRVRVQEVLEENGVDPRRLVVEITEQAFEADIEPVRETVRSLRELGVSIAVDDFGTGYSSLRYLQHLDLDIIKVDKRFLAQVSGSARQQNLVGGIVALARQLDLRIVAEGIEQEDQLAFVTGLGCDLGQGYLFSKPLPYAELAGLLAVPAGGAGMRVHLPEPRAAERLGQVTAR